MTDATVDFVRATRQSIKAMADETTVFAVAALSSFCAIVVGLSIASIFGNTAGVSYGVATFVSLEFWIWMMLYARRAWLLSRAAFEVAADGIAETPAPQPEPPPEPAAPDPEPEPAATPLEQITSDATLMQLLLDMPTEKLQSIIDARSIRQH